MADNDDELSLSGGDDTFDEDLGSVPVTTRAKEQQESTINSKQPVKSRIIKGGTLSTKRKSQGKDKGPKPKITKKGQNSNDYNII